MSWYELLLSLHILSAALWFGSSLAITVIAYRLIATQSPAFHGFARHAGWWAGRAHPAASVVLIVTAILMILDADLEIGELWVVLAFAGWLIAGGLGGSAIGPAAQQLDERLATTDGQLTADAKPIADRLLLFTRIELAILALVVFDMVSKPG